MVAAPGMVGAVPVGGQRAGEVRRGEGRHLRAHVHAPHAGQGLVQIDHGLGQLGQVVGLVVVLVVVGVVAVHVDEEDLALDPQGRGRRHHPRHGVDLLQIGVGLGRAGDHVGIGRRRGQGRDRRVAHGRIDGGDGVQGADVHGRIVAGDVHRRGRVGDQGLDSLGGRRGAIIARARRRRDRHRRQGPRADLVLEGGRPGQEHPVARRRGGREDGVRAVARHDPVADHSAIAELRPLDPAGLPHGLLVVVREQVARDGHRRVVVGRILGLGGGLDQGPHIGDDRQPPLGVEGQDRGQHGVQGEGAGGGIGAGGDRLGGLGHDGQDAAPGRRVVGARDGPPGHRAHLADGDRGRARGHQGDGRAAGVAGGEIAAPGIGIRRQDGVVAVVAALLEDADDGLVVRLGARPRRPADGGQLGREGQGPAGDEGGSPRIAEEAASAGCLTGHCGPTSGSDIRGRRRRWRSPPARGWSAPP